MTFEHNYVTDVMSFVFNCYNVLLCLHALAKKFHPTQIIVHRTCNIVACDYTTTQQHLKVATKVGEPFVTISPLSASHTANY